MKLLLLSVAVLFLTGAKGRSFWQHDEPSPDVGESLSKMLNQVYDTYVNVFSELKFDKIADELKITEKINAADDNIDKILVIIEEYFNKVEEAFKSKLHDHAPILADKVVPKLDEFEDKLEAVVLETIRGIIPVGAKLSHGIKKHTHELVGKLKTAAEKAQDDIRASVDEFHDKVKPYADTVRTEYEHYRKEVKDNLDEKVKHAKDNVAEDLKQLLAGVNKFLKDIEPHLGPRTQKAIHKLVDVVKDLIFEEKGEEQSQNQESH